MKHKKNFFVRNSMFAQAINMKDYMHNCCC
jgi:hypothetical protein